MDECSKSSSASRAESLWDARKGSVLPRAIYPSKVLDQRAYRAIFFDLDGTLLPMELEDFLGTYFRAIAQFVGKHGFDMEQFTTGLKAGTAAMAVHDDNVTNREAFWKAFFTHVDEEATEWDVFISEFYEKDFGKIGQDVKANPTVARVLKTLAEKGYPLVLTTMPMFPHPAVQWRLEWAGASTDLFARLTTYENSTSVKPKLDYYAENLAACGLSGEEVLMVGNNTVEDLAILGLGADAFLITDHLLDPVDYDLSQVKNGTMDEFAAWVDLLPACANPAISIERGVVEDQARQAVLEACLRTSSDCPTPAAVGGTSCGQSKHCGADRSGE